MKSLYKTALLVFFSLLIPGQVLAYSVNGTVVGSEDLLIAAGDLRNANDLTEEAWIESVLSSDIDYVKTDASAISLNEVDEAGLSIQAFELASDTDWFLIKAGASKTDTDGVNVKKIMWFLFENSDDQSWAVFDRQQTIEFPGVYDQDNEWTTFMAALGLGGDEYTLVDIEITGFSHVASPVSAVPLPATVWLFGAALLGFVSRAKSRV